MSQNIIPCKVNKNICEALGCFAEATKEIKVPVGTQGIISLRLCENCVAKFRED